MAHARTALVTGGAQRIGRAVALALAGDGYDLAVQYRSSAAAAETLAREVKALGRRIVTLKTDFLDRSAPQELIRQARESLGSLGALIHAASAFEPDTLLDFTEEAFDLHMRTNFEGPVRLVQAFVRASAGAPGAVILFTDQRVLKPTPQFFTYTLSKLALHQAVTTMAQAAAPAVRVNAIAPGPTLRNARQSPSDFEAQQRATLLGAGSPPDEIVRAVRYLLEAQAVTGHMITVDGGQHLIWQTPDVVGLTE